ncbi:putative HDEL sequence binding protein [Mariannaea sp. PMI_226]|nr:putative HDEL sequence binding protein [Mariannaea sp. PMI_226]
MGTNNRVVSSNPTFNNHQLYPNSSPLLVFFFSFPFSAKLAIMSLNIFRVAADFSHLGSILILLHKMTQLNSCSGISFKSQALYMFVYVTRYLDIFTTTSIYNLIFKFLFLGAQGYIIYLMTNAYKPTNDPNVDTFKVQYLIAGATVLGVLFPVKYTIKEILWAFSIWLESVAILPQLFMLQRTGEAETITTHYLFALGSYRALYIPNWIYRYLTEPEEKRKIDTIAIIAGLIQTVLYTDFFYVYYTKVLKGKKFKLPV